MILVLTHQINRHELCTQNKEKTAGLSLGSSMSQQTCSCLSSKGGGGGSTLTTGRAATLTHDLQIKLAVSSTHRMLFVCLLVGCLMSQKQASVSQGRICSDNFTCCHTEIEVADPTFYLTQSQYTDTGLTSPSADPITPRTWQGSHWSDNFEVTGMT